MFARLAALVLVLAGIVSAHAPVAETNEQWLERTLTAYSVEIPDNVVVSFTDDPDNCGSQKSEHKVGGGCTITWEDGSVSVLISPVAVANGTGDHILLHELGHALYAYGECSAEAYAHRMTSANPWHVLLVGEVWAYPSCK